jgi:hypothetical protein
MKNITELGKEYMEQSEKLRLRAAVLKAGLNSRSMSAKKYAALQTRIKLLLLEYGELRKTGLMLINYYKKMEDGHGEK